MGEGYSLKRLDAMEAYEKRYQYLAEKFPELEIKARRAIVAACIYHGQMALIHLSKREREQAFQYLESVINQYSIKRSEYSELKITHRLWLDIAQVSLKTACRVKNALGVGK